jgi:hypothetical protein
MLPERPIGALRHQAWMAPSQSYGLVSLPLHATVQQHAQAVVIEIAEAVPNALDLLDRQAGGGLLRQVLAMRRQAGP